MNKIKNVNDLTNELIEAFEMVKADPRRVPQGKELGNLGGKIINSMKIQLEYRKLRKETPDIPFLNVNTPSAIA